MNLDFTNIPKFETKKLDLPVAPFLSYQPDFKSLRALWQEFGMFKNILLIGHGGSVTSFMGIYQALPTQKNVFVLSTTDPEYILALKKQLPKHETLVIAISKSGETVTQIEALMHFVDYSLLFVTGAGSTLEQIGKQYNAKIIPHPDIGGRYTAFTEVGLVPAAICGIDVEALYKGASTMFAKYNQDNLAMQAAQAFYSLEQQGIVDVFMPFYSHYMFAFSNLIVQLCHESFGKAGKGQTYFAHEAPESQHHTNQRFFGGRKNIAGFFIKLDTFRADEPTVVPPKIQDIAIKDGTLANLNKIPLSFSMHSEYNGTLEDAKIQSIPVISLNLEVIDPVSIGQFIAFWQMYAVYSSVLRDVDPFDQPQVENSKKISWQKRKGFKG